jgi:hypothetical protein
MSAHPARLTIYTDRVGTENASNGWGYLKFPEGEFGPSERSEPDSRMLYQCISI